MSNVRELLAWLNPTTVRLDVGRGGGAPSLTPQDIAAALGMVPAGLGREVLIACGWPEGGARRFNQLRNAVNGLVLPELSRQARLLSAAHLDLQLAEAAVLWTQRPRTVEQMHEIERLRNALTQQRAHMWPRNVIEHLAQLTAAVLLEIFGGHRCEDCDGRLTVMVDCVSKDCNRCKGSGLEPQRDRRRAIAIGCDPSDYPKRWKTVYEWLLTRMSEAGNEAAAQLSIAIGREEAA